MTDLQLLFTDICQNLLLKWTIPKLWNITRLTTCMYIEALYSLSLSLSLSLSRSFFPCAYLNRKWAFMFYFGVDALRRTATVIIFFNSQLAKGTLQWMSVHYMQTYWWYKVSSLLFLLFLVLIFYFFWKQFCSFCKDRDQYG